MGNIYTKFGDNPISKSKVMKEIEENTKIKMAAKIERKNKQLFFLQKLNNLVINQSTKLYANQLINEKVVKQKPF